MLHLVVIDGNTIALAVLIEEGIGLCMPNRKYLTPKKNE